jgi:hypothetical protein
VVTPSVAGDTITGRRRLITVTTRELLALPVGIVSVPLALLGRSPAGARRQRDLARRDLGLRVDEPSHRDTAGRVLAHALLGVPLNAIALALTAYLWLLVPLHLAYSLRPGTMGSYQDAWGGPTLAGAWAVHAVGRAGDPVRDPVDRQGNRRAAGPGRGTTARCRPLP